MFGFDKYTNTVLMAYGVAIAMLAILIVLSLMKSNRSISFHHSFSLAWPQQCSSAFCATIQTHYPAK